MYGVVSVAVCVLLVYVSDKWAAPDRIDSFTYWCGVATLVALVIAVGEIVHAGTATNAVNLALSATARQEARTLSAEVIALVDEVSESMRAEDYTAALRAVQIARRFVARLDFKHVLPLEGNAIAEKLGDVEHALQRALNDDRGKPMTRAGKTELNDVLMTIKRAAERLANLEGWV
jgi:hypothetical protein